MPSDMELPGSDKNTLVIAQPLSISGSRKIKMGNPIDAAWFNSNLVSASLIRNAGFVFLCDRHHLATLARRTTRFATSARIRKQHLNQPLVSLMHLLRRIIATGMFICFSTGMASADNSYRVNPGDILLVYVWNEKDLTQEVLVRPDGAISIPLAGQVMAGGLSVIEVEKNLSDALAKYMKDRPAVTVTIKETRGYAIYVLGKVNRPGQFPINQPTDVMQALAMAGGLNAFAAESSINVLRRDQDGSQKAIRFRYSDVKSGDELQTNILLQSGDVVVVP